MTTELIELRGATDSHAAECARLTDRVRLLESTVDATHAERKQLDQELALAKEESSSRHIEISRLSTLLENARSKVRYTYLINPHGVQKSVPCFFNVNLIFS